MIEFFIAGAVILAFIGLVAYAQRSPKQAKEEPKEEPKKAPEFKKTKKLVFNTKKVDIGTTSVDLTFTDGRTFTVYLDGEVSQRYRDYTNDTNYYTKETTWKEAYVEQVRILKSENVAESFISRINGNEIMTFVDYQPMPTVAVTGVVAKAEIHETLENIIEFYEAKLEDL